MSRSFRLHVDQGSPMPLAGQIAAQLKWLIASGTLGEGDELPPAQELADELGINLHTVRAGYQQLETQKLVSLGRGRRARVLAYDRTKAVESSSRVPSYAIGLIIPEFIQLYGPLLEGTESAAAQQPALVFVANAHEDPATALLALDRLVARGVDGIIVAAPLLDPGIDLPTLNRPPIVFIDAPGSPGTSIEFDLEGSQYLATSHLIQHGHRRIGFITPPIQLANVSPKQAGHNRALRDGGIDPDSRLTVQVEDFRIASGEDAARKLLTETEPPTAITAASDQLAVGVYQAAHKLGMHIPDDLAVTGNDNSELSAIIDPKLTTVTLPVRLAGQLAVEAIRQIQDGNPGPTQITLDVELVVRNSCGCKA